MPVVYVRGLVELRLALAKASKDAPHELAVAHQQVGRIVVVEAQLRAPKGPHQGGGKVIPISRSIRASLSATRVRVTAGGPATPHAAVEEFGGSIPRRGHKGLGRTGKRLARLLGGRGLTRVKAHPYLIPALTAKQAQVVEAYRAMLVRITTKFGV